MDDNERKDNTPETSVLSFHSSSSIGEYVFLILFHFLLSPAVTRLFSCIKWQIKLGDAGTIDRLSGVSIPD